MGNLSGFDANTVKPSIAFEALPEGWYSAASSAVSSSPPRPAKASTWSSSSRSSTANTRAARSRQNESFASAVRLVVKHRNRRSVWSIPTKGYPGAHFATFPPKLVEPCILASCPIGGTVLDPFAGSGTTGMVAVANGRAFIGCELNPEYAEMARKRIASKLGLFHTVGGT